MRVPRRSRDGLPGRGAVRTRSASGRNVGYKLVRRAALAESTRADARVQGSAGGSSAWGEFHRPHAVGPLGPASGGGSRISPAAMGGQGRAISALYDRADHWTGSDHPSLTVDEEIIKLARPSRESARSLGPRPPVARRLPSSVAEHAATRTDRRDRVRPSPRRKGSCTRRSSSC